MRALFVIANVCYRWSPSELWNGARRQLLWLKYSDCSGAVLRSAGVEVYGFQRGFGLMVRL